MPVQAKVRRDVARPARPRAEFLRLDAPFGAYFVGKHEVGGDFAQGRRYATARTIQERDDCIGRNKPGTRRANKPERLPKLEPELCAEHISTIQEHYCLSPFPFCKVVSFAALSDDALA